MKQIHKHYDSTKMSPKYHSFTSLFTRIQELSNHTIVFNMEQTLLKSSSWFPFFMLVAFERGGLLRAMLLLLSFPLLCVVTEQWKLKIMVFICFFGVKKKRFRLGRTVLPKFFLEDVGEEVFEVLIRFGKRVAMSNFPRIMVEEFLKEYLGIEMVFGRELKEFGGFYLGLMEVREDETTMEVMNKVSREENLIGLMGSNETNKEHILTKCKDVYLVNAAIKEKWRNLPKDKYPKPLIFHDGRLKFLPTPMDTLIMFIWLPFGLVLSITRIFVCFSLPYKLSNPILAYLGTCGVRSELYSQTQNLSQDHKSDSKGIIYVCNHKTLLDPIYISFGCGFHLTALTYSISKMSELLSPIKTVTLTRNKEKDAKTMQEMLSKGSIVVCPEGTTCREHYLLRFSPLFAEISDEIVPVALDVKTTMFYGTTASGIKALDPIFFLLNPYPYYFVNFLEKLPKSLTCRSGGLDKIEVANYVQAEIGKALEFKCTNLTRKDKYLILAGNAGVFKN